MVDTGHEDLSVVRQCELIGMSRSSWYYRPTGDSERNLELMRVIDEECRASKHFGQNPLKN